MSNLSLTEQEKIEAFCRELAQCLRQITGSQVASSEEELASLAAQVTAEPAAPEAGDARSSEASTTSGAAAEASSNQPVKPTRKPHTHEQAPKGHNHIQRRRASR